MPKRKGEFRAHILDKGLGEWSYIIRNVDHRSNWKIIPERSYPGKHFAIAALKKVIAELGLVITEKFGW